jgi:hypothetical protein
MGVLHMGHQAVVAAASPDRRMMPVSLAAKLAAAEIELACLKLALAQVEGDRDKLRQNGDRLRKERDDLRREAETLCAEKLIIAKLRQADEQLEAMAAKRPWWRRLVGRKAKFEAFSFRS